MNHLKDKANRLEAEAIEISATILKEINKVLDCYCLEMTSLMLTTNGYVEVRDITKIMHDGEEYIIKFDSPEWEKMKAVAGEEV